MEKKALFIISLKYPLINAINIKVNLLKNKRADIILDDNQADIFDIAKRLESLDVFDNVYIVRGNSLKSIKYIFKGNNSIGVYDAIDNTLVNIKNKILRLINKEKFIESMKLYGGNIDLSQYDEMYLCSETEVSIACSDLLVKKYGMKNINLIEEGVRDYYTDVSIMKYKKRYGLCTICIFLYEKKLIVYGINNSCVRFYDIPKLDTSDLLLRNILNSVFDYKAIEKNIFDNKVIFFDQVSEPMPEYLRKVYQSKNILKKYILYNSIKKHLKEEKFYQDKCNIISYILDIEDISDNFYIKLHPRTKYGLENKYNKYVIGDKHNVNNIPWEIYLMNCSFENNLWYTMFSSSVFNSLYSFKKHSNIKICVLYRLMDNYDFPKGLISFIERIESVYNENIKIINR